MKKPAPVFWFMSIQAPTATGLFANSYQGVLTPKPGTTRLGLFNDIREEINRQDPRAIGGVVIAFDVQPNEL